MLLKKRKDYTDEQIIQGIREGGVHRQRLTQYLFDKHTGLVYNGMRKFRLSEADSVDVYSDTIIAVSLQIERGKFRGESKISTYLFAIFSNRCKNKLRDQKRDKFEWVDEMPDLPDHSRNMLTEIIANESVQELEQYFDRLGEKCKQILLLREYHGYNFQEIAEKIGFKSAQSVSSMKYRCMENLKKMIIKKVNL